jgi:hypothetical protein
MRFCPACLSQQVARRQDPMDDAAAVVAIRAAVGLGVVLRADANRLWTLNQAIAFASAAESADLEVHPPLTPPVPSTLFDFYPRECEPVLSS